jgi:hypothetical protein
MNPRDVKDNYLLMIASRNESVTIGTTNVLVSQSKISSEQKAKIRMYTNTSIGGQVITLNFGNSVATAGNGIVLQPNQNVADSSDEGYECWQGTVNGIASAAGGTLAVFER